MNEESGLRQLRSHYRQPFILADARGRESIDSAQWGRFIRGPIDLLDFCFFKFLLTQTRPHLCAPVFPVGRLVSRTGRSISPDAAGASSASVSMNPRRAMLLAHTLSSAVM